ncbi:MAG: RNA-directed DNA polymerase, partial [Parcubacteria group bacterium]
MSDNNFKIHPRTDPETKYSNHQRTEIEAAPHAASAHKKTGIGAETYCLKCDVSKCFFSINHRILFKQFQKVIADKNILWLLREIIGSFETGNEFDCLFPPDSPFRNDRPRGIPIGNLTSQLFVNIYLNALDQHAKHILKAKYYIRYVDDFIVLHSDKKYLHDLRNTIQKFLRNNLNLELHPKKQRIFPASQGIDFLGYVVFPDYCLLRKSNKENFKKKLRKVKE